MINKFYLKYLFIILAGVFLIFFINKTDHISNFYFKCIYHGKPSSEYSISKWTFFTQSLRRELLMTSESSYKLDSIEIYNKKELYDIQFELWNDIQFVLMIYEFGENSKNQTCKSTYYFRLAKKKYENLISLYKFINLIIETKEQYYHLILDIGNLEKKISIMNHRIKYMEQLSNEKL